MWQPANRFTVASEPHRSSASRQRGRHHAGHGCRAALERLGRVVDELDRDALGVGHGLDDLGEVREVVVGDVREVDRLRAVEAEDDRAHRGEAGGPRVPITSILSPERTSVLGGIIA